MMVDQLVKDIFHTQEVFFKTQKTKPLQFRLQSLKALKRAILEMESEISEALFNDLHKSGFEAYTTEIGFVLEELSYAIRHLKRWMKPEGVVTGITSFPARSFVMNEPLGQVLIISPWNYPFQLLIAPLIGAIAAGNTVMLKPSEISHHTSAVLAKLVNQVFQPNHVALVEGDATVSQALLKLKFDHIFFTGSPRVGQIVMQEAAKQLIPVTLELGGKSPCIVNHDVDIKLTARRIAWGKLLNAGQTCIAPDYVLVHRDVQEKLLEALAEAFRQAYGADPYTSIEYPRIITEANTVRLKTLLEGCEIYSGGHVVEKERYVEPTILKNVKAEMEVMKSEIFGPILPVLTFSHTDEVINFINQRPKPLALYCFSDDRTFLKKVINEVPSGGVTINDTLMHISNNQLPFGGVGNSGTGSYHGKYSFDVFSHKKSVMVRGTWLDVPLRYAPFGQKVKWIKMLMK